MNNFQLPSSSSPDSPNLFQAPSFSGLTPQNEFKPASSKGSKSGGGSPNGSPKDQHGNPFLKHEHPHRDRPAAFDPADVSTLNEPGAKLFESREPGQPALYVDLTTNLSQPEQECVKGALESLNTALGMPVIKFEREPNLYPVVVSMVDIFPGTGEQLGYAGPRGHGCHVQLRRGLCKGGEAEQFLESATWHEFGHCVNLGHTPNEGEIMHGRVGPIQTYDRGAIDRFLRDFKSQLGYGS